MGMAGFYLVFALYVQEGRGLDALGAGLIFVVNGAGYMASSSIAWIAAAKRGRQVLALAGMLRAVGLSLLLWTVVKLGDKGNIMWLVPSLFINGLGTGFAVASTVLSRMTAQHAGAVSGVLTTGIQVGNGIGVAIIGVIFYGSLTHGGSRSYGNAFAYSLAYLILNSLTLPALVQLLPRTGDDRK